MGFEKYNVKEKKKKKEREKEKQGHKNYKKYIYEVCFLKKIGSSFFFSLQSNSRL